jgi:hypothetical protein
MSSVPVQTDMTGSNVLSLPAGTQVLVVPSARRPIGSWIIITLLAVIATAIVMRWDEAALTRAALAQVATPGAAPVGARGIYAFTGQLTSKSYGLFMMDVDSGTIWCYEMQRGANGEPQMKLVAARSWIYDRYLEEFNAADPIPSAVKNLVQQKQSNRPAGASPAEEGAAGSPADAPALPANPNK